MGRTGEGRSQGKQGGVWENDASELWTVVSGQNGRGAVMGRRSGVWENDASGQWSVGSGQWAERDAGGDRRASEAACGRTMQAGSGQNGRGAVMKAERKRKASSGRGLHPEHPRRGLVRREAGAAGD